MFFNTIQYLIFLPLVLVLYYLTGQKYRWVVLFFASCFFYIYFIPKYILCLFFLILVDFYAAKKINACANTKYRKSFLVFSILSNFGLLFYFKYLGFFGETVNLVLVPLLDLKLDLHNDILPIGLSFHTFQSVSYVIDVYKNKIKPEKHLGIYSTYVLFFPQMVAGPIERFSTLGRELKQPSLFRFDLVRKALPLILTGLFYKMVIADNCGEYVNMVYSHLSDQNSYNVFIAVLFFCIQIYSDFFGYSLIAQGSAKLFDIDLAANFSYPLFSENIVVFWRKWHISLTNWFRDYVYIPMGGSKKSRTKHYLNIALVFTLSGLWHGAGFNFILWGCFHAFAYLLVLLVFNRLSLKLPIFLKYLVTFLLVSFIFVFFRAGQLSESMEIIKIAFQNRTSFDFKPVSCILLLNLLFVFFIELHAKKHGNYLNYFDVNRRLGNTLIFSYMLFATLTFSGIDNLPFIYFQF